LMFKIQTPFHYYKQYSPTPLIFGSGEARLTALGAFKT
jgi:hypothetical protein